MRKIKGEVVLPADSPTKKAGLVIVEVRDVSVADAPSTVVAERHLKNVSLKPNGRIKFEIPVPELSDKRTYSLRVHVSHDGSTVVKSGDLLTTAHYPVPAEGTPAPLDVATTVI